MKLLFFACILSSVIFQSCNEHSAPAARQIINKEFDWKIEIPEGFDTVPAAQWKKIENRGAEAIEKTTNEKIYDRPNTIFVFRSGQFDLFESNYQSFDTTTDGNYLESVKTVNELIYTTFETQMPGTRLDSASSKETIDGKVFHVYKVTVTFPNKMVMDALMYSRLFGNKDFTVSITTVNKEKQRALLHAWRNSTFGKK